MSYGELRVEVLNIGFGFVLLAGGLLLVLLPALYRSGKDPALITFGAGVSLYGAVTLAQLLSIRAVVPLPSAVWEYAVAFGLYIQADRASLCDGRLDDRLPAATCRRPDPAQS